MSDIMPWMFAALAGGVLLAGLWSFWQSVRAAFGAADVDAVQAVVESEERAGLEDEKQALLRSIKDIELERDLGKMSDDDFARLDASLRTRAREVLKLLDEEVAPFREQAEKMIAKHIEGVSKRAPYRSRAEQAPAEDTIRCAKCQTPNDVDASFCKRCGAAIVAAKRESDEPPPVAEAGEGEPKESPEPKPNPADPHEGVPVPADEAETERRDRPASVPDEGDETKKEGDA